MGVSEKNYNFTPNEQSIKDSMASENRMLKWLEIVDRDIDAAEWMQKGGRWLYVAFECHQALEKAIKAYWCGMRDDEPPYIHDHWRLLEGCGLGEKLTDEQKAYIDLLKPMYIAARYPEHKQRVAVALNEQACQGIIEQTKQFKQWLLQEYSAAMKPSSSSDNTSR